MFRIQPDLRFPSFKEQWKKTVLGDISKRPMYGVGASAVEFNNKDVYVRITDIEDKSRKLMSRNFTSPSIVNEKYLLKNKDILFARTGASTGKTYIHENYELKYDYYFAGFLIKFEILKSYYPDFIYQYTLTNSYENWVKVMSVRSGQPGINSEEYSKLKLNIPRYEEQKKIGDFFSKLDRQIELEEQKLEKLEEQKKGYMQKIFSQELRFKDNNGEEYPKWESKKLEEVAIINTGKSKIVNEESAAYSNLGSTGVLGKSSHYEYDGNFILTARVGHYAGKLYNFSGKANISDNTIFLETDLNLNFTLNMLNNYNLKRIAFGSGQPLIKSSELKKLIFNIPCGEEEQKIGGFLSGFDSLIGKQSHKIELLKERKKGFLQKMFV